MRFAPLYRARKTVRSSKPAQWRAIASACLEALEDRRLLSATVCTDQLDYPPGSTALISGSGFAPSEMVELQLSHASGTPVGAGHVPTQPWMVQADAAGSFNSSWAVTDPDAVGATYVLLATGLSDGEVAQTEFTDKTDAVAGTGHMTLTTSPALTAGSTGNTLTFTFGFNPGDMGHIFKSGSQATILIPAGWTQPQSTNASAPGYVVAAGTGGGTATVTGITGSPATGWTVTMSIADDDGQGFTLTYGGGGTKVTAPLTGTYTFTTQTRSSGQTLTTLLDGSSPKVSFLVDTSLASGAATGVYGSTTTLSATLLGGITPLAGKTVTFSLNGNAVGSATTDANGIATLQTSLLGIDAGSYATGVVASFAGDDVYATSTSTSSLAVSQASLTVSATGINRVYDGTTGATVTLSDDRLAGDALILSYTTATFGDKNAGVGKTISISGIGLSGADAGNYTLASATATTTADITAATLTVTAKGVNRVYDGTTGATVTLSDDRVAGDMVVASYTAAAFGDKNVGAGKTVSVSGISLSGADAGNYILASTAATTTADVTAAMLTVNAVGVNRVYDRTTGASVTLRDDRVSGDSLTLSYGTAVFNDKNVGVSKTVSVSGISVSGVDAGNYALQSTIATTTADITAATLTVAASGANRAYDGTTGATVTLSDDRIEGDSLTASYTTATFDDKNAGVGKTISVSGIAITGADAGNYILASDTATATADIAAAALTVTATGVNRTYNGTTGAAVTLSDDRISGDSLTLSYTAATFGDKNAGLGKTISVSGISVGGVDAGNYILASDTATATANIAAAALTVTATGVNRTYNGTSGATVTMSDDRVSGDSLSLSYATATFADKNAGLGKAISVSGISVSGADAGNYVLASDTAAATANIAAATLTVTATGVSRTYNGTTGATVTLSDDRISGDSLTLSYTTATFADKNAGLGKAISVSGISVSGADAGNYTLASDTVATTGDIAAATLTVTAHGLARVYNGTNSAAVTLSDDRISGDSLTLSYTTATFDDKNVGTGKTISVSGVAIAGADAGNYTLAATTAPAAADVTPATISGIITAANKVYDSTTAATISGRSLTDVFGDDAVMLSGGVATFADRNVGTGKTVTAVNLTLTGTDAANYVLSSTTATAAADITPATLTISATGFSKIYDGTDLATVTLADDRFGSDLVTTSYVIARFSDKNVGKDKPVSVSGLAIDGPDAGNYVLASTSAATTADITAAPLALIVRATGINKVYDGTIAATVTLSDNRIAGDSLSLSYATATFDDKNVGTGKTISVSGIAIAGADAANYSLALSTATTAADITPATLAVTAGGVNRVYDGTTGATVTLSDDRISGDAVILSYTTASFDDRNVAAGKLVSVSGIAIAGADAANYILASTGVTTTADITPAMLTVTATAQNKLYDGKRKARVTLLDDRIGDDLFTLGYASAQFKTAVVGKHKRVLVSGLALSGSDAGNYQLVSTTAAAKANIIALPLPPVPPAVVPPTPAGPFVPPPQQVKYNWCPVMRGAPGVANHRWYV